MLSGTDCAEMNEDGFSDELARLKRQGAGVLVVGSVRPDQRRDACRRLLGQESEQLRRRILVSTTGDSHQLPLRVDDPDPETFSPISYDAQARSAAASSPPAGPSIPASPTEVDTLADLGIAISSAIESFETDAGGLEPAELRVGIDSLLPLLEEYGKQQLFKFLHLTNGRTRDVNGMAHYHLPVERDARIVPILSPLFDIVVELREQNGNYQERWIIDDGTHSSGWLSVGPK
ncbi:DUF7504 family protein [Natrinema marinum]|uniref:DUF7504 family protein n=1 Tax=Natrinema marinum TaxID=2961598 RepID=UPI003CE49E8A